VVGVGRDRDKRRAHANASDPDAATGTVACGTRNRNGGCERASVASLVREKIDAVTRDGLVIFF
jgi:hypothetical protein